MSTSSATRYRILAVDDDRGTLVLYRGAFADPSDTTVPEAFLVPSFDLSACLQAEEAVAEVEKSILEQRPFSVAFVDVCLPPGPDGVWAAEKIRELDPDIQIVMVTGSSDAHPEEITSRVPPREKIIYLRKPLHPLELQNFAASFSAKWQAEREVATTRQLLEIRVAEQTSDLRRSEEQIAFQAYHDALTKLPNRLLFNDRLRVAIAHSRRRKQGMAVLFLDLDHFKTVNDSRGHPAGDELLKVVADRLVECVREDDTVARLGGDEFIILLQEATDPSYTVRIAERILASIAKPIPIKEHEFYITTSIGITLFPDDGETPEALVANADIAMYRAKEGGRDRYMLFTPSMNKKVMARVALEVSLRQALKNEQLVVHYQPIQVTESGLIIGMEALVRWQRPEEDLIYPNDFIPLAEETGLIVPLGEWVLRTACADAKGWHDRGSDDIFVSVNLSPRQFRFGNVAALVEDVLRETGLPARYLTLEITEGAVMQNVAEGIRTMRTLTDLGVKLSMDDFGRGYSSLSHLKSFPVSTLKIDRSFVGDLALHASDASIVRAIISMGRSLDLDVVAEGVETIEQLEFLKDHHCDHIQGFFLHRPMPLEAIERLLFPGLEDPIENDSGKADHQNI